ncbi:MAG: ribonuclease P protein component [Planctomycetota bacterium]
MRFRFPAQLRVRRRREFERAFAWGIRASDARLTIWAYPNGLDHPRLGLIVGRKHGNAVRRNRIKRVLREAFRLSQHNLPAGLDLLCAPRRGAEIELEACTQSLRRLATRLARHAGLERS